MSSDLSRNVRSAEKIVDACQPELHAHSEDIEGAVPSV
jgi:iron uptake system EfeUOB component EfeO/EfeM